MAGFGQVENRPTGEEGARVEHDMPRRDDRQTLDVQQRSGHGTMSREFVLGNNNKFIISRRDPRLGDFLIIFIFSVLYNTLVAQMKEFWKHLAWPDLIQSYNFVLKLLDVNFLSRV